MAHNLNMGIVFIALAIIYVGLALRDYLKSENKLTPARLTWLRIAFIFSGVGIFLYAVRLVSHFLPPKGKGASGISYVGSSVL